MQNIDVAAVCRSRLSQQSSYVITAEKTKIQRKRNRERGWMEEMRDNEGRKKKRHECLIEGRERTVIGVGVLQR